MMELGAYTPVIIRFVVAFVSTAIATPLLSPVLRRIKAGQSIREEGPQSHLSKAGTPSMGGIAIIIGAVSASLLVFRFSADLAVTLLVFLGFGLVGFLDDYLKVIKKNNLGLRAYQKFGLQMIFSFAYAFIRITF